MSYPYFSIQPAPVRPFPARGSWPCGRCHGEFDLRDSWQVTHGWGAVAIVGYVCPGCAAEVVRYGAGPGTWPAAADPDLLLTAPAAG